MREIVRGLINAATILPPLRISTILHSASVSRGIHKLLGHRPKLCDPPIGNDNSDGATTRRGSWAFSIVHVVISLSSSCPFRRYRFTIFVSFRVTYVKATKSKRHVRREIEGSAKTVAERICPSTILISWCVCV